MQEFLIAYIAIISTINLIAIAIHHRRESLPRIYVNGKPSTVEQAKSASGGAIRIQKDTRKGSIFIPPSDIEIERQRVIDERGAQGLDTPIDLLRERTNEE